MKVEIDYSCSDRFAKMILDKKFGKKAGDEDSGIFIGSLKDFIETIKELDGELKLGD